MNDNFIRLTIDFNDPNLESEKRDEQAQGLITELRDIEDLRSYRVVDPNPLSNTKSINGFVAGKLQVLATAANAEKLMKFLGDRLGNKSIELTLEFDDKKLSVKASSREELDYAIKAAAELIKEWKK